ncbi:MAG: D-alanyl-D-alanine carboxypeptidase [Azoarcus sp.]|jgi:D-alanyl-D-alanine carboxypeptidase (penicillin-binding protein 5/6)|nr:D-alanyl-D-alanine carboxypeptidase [Azoarcus sp.]
MHQSAFRLFFAALFALCASAAFAQTTPAPVLAAKSWILIDQSTGQTLAGNDSDARIEPASLTKLMTAYLTFSALKAGTISEQQMVLVSEKAWRQEGSRMFIQVGTEVSVSELIRGVIVQSGNDASTALAELIGGSVEGFAALMNREAERLGMKNTHFTNPTGLPDPQLYTTARDLSKLASAIIRDFPQYFPIYSMQSYTYNNIAQPNRNRLLFIDPTVDGMKTGHTDSAGFCLVSTARRGERRLVSVVLGAASDNVRAQESLKLLNYGFQAFDTVRVYPAGQTISKFRVWKGQNDEVSVGFDHDLILSLPREKVKQIGATLESRQPLIAPLAKGQEVGTLKLTVAGEPYGEYPVVVQDEVPLAGFFKRLWDAIKLWFKSL